MQFYHRGRGIYLILAVLSGDEASAKCLYKRWVVKHRVHSKTCIITQVTRIPISGAHREMAGSAFAPEGLSPRTLD